MKRAKKIQITMVGVGGGGINSLINVYDKIHGLGLDINYLALNTNKPSKHNFSNKKIKTITMGKKTTNEIITKSNPLDGYKAIRKKVLEIDKILDNTDILFISAGLGGGTGSGAVPFLVERAKDKNILTIVFATFPWEFEGAQRKDNALLSLNSMVDYADSIIVMNNESLKKNRYLGKTDKLNVFIQTDEFLRYAVITIATLILERSIINIDFNDIKHSLKSTGFGFFFILDTDIKKIREQKNISESEIDIIYNNLKATFVSDLNVSGSKNLLVNVSGNSTTLSMHMINGVFNKLKVDSPGLNIMFGLSFNEFMDDGRIQMSAIYSNVTYTSIGFDKKNDKKPTLQLLFANEQAIKKEKKIIATKVVKKKSRRNK